MQLVFLVLCTKVAMGQEERTVVPVDSVYHVQNNQQAASDTVPSSEPVKANRKTFAINWRNLPYEFDDMTVLVGVSSTGLYYSNYYRELSYIAGYTIGVEDFIPVFEKAFLHFGLKYSRRGFEHSDYNIRFKTHNIDVPLFLSYELPAMRLNDLRLLFGTQFAFRTGSTTEGTYTPPQDYYFFNPILFSNFDFGFLFGLSAEFNNFYVSFRGFTGFVKLMPDDTAMNSSFGLEFGYFVFRNLRK